MLARERELVEALSTDSAGHFLRVARDDRDGLLPLQGV